MRTVSAIGRRLVSRDASAHGVLRTATAAVLAAVCCGAITTCAWADGSVKDIGGGVAPVVRSGAAQAVGERPASTPLHVTVGLSTRDKPELDAVIAAASTPGGPRYGKYLSRAEYMSRFAPTGAQVAAVESWLRSEGLHVTGSSKDDLLVYAGGSTAALRGLPRERSQVLLKQPCALGAR